jgi:Bacterial pre-peptidase C-terminal domain/Bacterial Ig-like domain
MSSKRSARRRARVRPNRSAKIRGRTTLLEALETRFMLSSTPVKFTRFGDANLDGVVDNTSDYDLWSSGFAHGKGGWINGDFNGDGVVDNTSDYDLWSTGFAQNSDLIPVGQLLSGHGRWLATFAGLEPGEELSDQTVVGQNLLHAAGISDSDIFVVTAVDLSGTFDLLTPVTATQQSLTEKLQAVPGFLGVHENDAYLAPLEGSFGTISGPDDPDTAASSADAPALAPGTWSQTTIAPTTAGTMMLLSNGRVMAQGGGVSKAWYQLTPDANGSYTTGTWSSLASMNLERLYFGSNVLQNGKVFLVGGEYSGPSGTNNWINSGEIDDPVANTWSNITTFPQSQFGDDPTAILPNGNILAGYLSGPQTYIYNPTANTWTVTGTKLRNDRSDEESWVILPDNSILSYDVFSSISLGVGHAQRYVPSNGTWVDTGTVPVSLSSSALGYELGPAFLLADGRVFQIGANSNTALYNPTTNTWTAGPVIPNGKGADDAPGAVLPDGHVIFAADTPLFNAPTQLFDFDPVANTITQVSSLPAQLVADLSSPAYIMRMLVLPSGQLMLATGTSNRIWIFTPSDSPVSNGQPTITGVSQNGDGTFTLSGTLFNGISEGASYGDDAEMSSNYPIVRLTDSAGHVYYGRTSNWSKTGVATGTTPVTTQFALPAGLPNGSYSLVVVANGIASAPINFSQPFQFAVASSTPANGAIVSTLLSSYVINFNDTVDPTSLQAGDLLVNGQPANGVTLSPSQLIATFTYNTSPITAQGLQTISMAANSVSKTGSGTGIAAFNSSFRYDAVLLQVTSTSPAAGGVFTLPVPLTYDVNFNEAMDPASVQTSDLLLSGISGATVSGVSVLAGNTTARFTIGGITAEGTLSASIAAGAINDAFGNPGAAFAASYQVDINTAAFPVPLASKLPLGSLVYDPTASGTIGISGDTDTFTLAVDAGQTITILVTPTTGSLQPNLQLLDPASTVIGTATASAAGQKALIQTVPATSAGTYSIAISGAGTTTGGYTVQVILNAAEESEGNLSGVTNNTAATAQDLSASFLSLGGIASRGAVLGTISSTTDLDFYAVPLVAGDTITVALKGLSSTAVSAQIRDSSGSTVLATGISGPTNLDRVLTDFTAASSGTYYVVISGTITGATYDAVITKNAEFNSEANNSIAQAQELLSRQSSGDQWVLGHVGASGDTVDLYKVNLAAGASLSAQTSTPADGPGEFVNTLNPRLRLLDSSGAQLALDDNSAADGKNAVLNFTNSGPAAVFYVEVSSTTATTTQGEYLLRLTGNSVTLPSFKVATMTPANGSTLRGSPGNIIIDFNDAVLQSSISASDLQIDGVGATAFNIIDGDTVNFTFGTSFADGAHNITIAAGAILDLQSTAIDAFTATIFEDTTAPRVVSTSVSPNAVVLPGALTYQITFSEPMLVSNLSSDDFALHGNLRNANYTATSSAYSGGGTILTLNYAGLPDDNYTLTLVAGTSGGTNFTDAAGNALDGEFTGVFPSGNGTAGGNFIIGFSMDGGTEAFPTPLIAQKPLGSLVYDPSVTRTIAFGGDSDAFTISVDAGQTITVLATGSSGLQPQVQLLDPSNTVIGTATATAANQNALLQSVATSSSSSGAYTILVSGAGGTTGLYALQLVLNAALESEPYLPTVKDDTLATAQNLDSTSITLSPSASRLSALGVIGLATSVVDFELGSIPSSITTYSSNSFGRIRVMAPGGTGNSSAFALIMDSNVDGNYALNEAVYTVDLTGVTQATLSFSHINFGDEAETMPTTFSGHFNGDGVAISADGNTWATVFNATTSDTTWTTTSVDLAAAAAAAGMTLGPNFKVKFQQYDNFGITTDGRGYDNITVAIPDPADNYSFNLAAGQSVAIALAAQTSGNLNLELRDASNALLASGAAGATNLTKVISNFVAATTGTYYARITGDAGVFYGLVLTRNAAFDTESNDTFATAQNITGTKGVLGYVAGGAATTLFDLTGPTVTGSTILTGSKITLGFNADGSFITATAGTGIRYNGTEFVALGTPVASFTVGYNGLTYTNNAVNGVSQITGITKQDISSGTLKGLRIVGTAGASVRIERVVVFNQNDDYVTIATRLTNLSGAALSNVATLENYDPDQLSSTTLNDVVLSGKFVRASASSGLTMGIGSIDSRSVVSAEGFDNRNPFDIINSPADPNGASGDIAIAQAFNFGSLAALAQTSGIAVLAFGTTAAAADAVFSANSAGTLPPAQPDWFSINVINPGNLLQLATTTPGDGSGEFVNTLNPHIELYDPSNNLVASGTIGADGRNETIQYAPLVAGSYRVKVTGEGTTSGEYFLNSQFAPLSTIQTVTIDDGTAQRSRVRSITLVFNGTITTAPSSAFSLVRTEDGLVVPVIASALTPLSGNRTQLTLTFSGASLAAGSLADGRYVLTIDGNQIIDSLGQKLDAAGTGVAGSSRQVNFLRFFGDSNGDGVVDGLDYLVFRAAYVSADATGANSAYDADGDGVFTTADLQTFTDNFTTRILI